MDYVKLYDTTLRDGTQMEGVSLSVHDKLKIAERLDHLGVNFIEGGWPGSNPKDDEFFQAAKTLKLNNAELVAFGSTCRAHMSPEDDSNISALVDSGAKVLTIVGKSSDFQVEKVLQTSLEENMNMIADSVSYLKSKNRIVFFDSSKPHNSSTTSNTSGRFNINLNFR